MSGGVDSSVAAYLLAKQGYPLVGVSMQVWDYKKNSEENSRATCCSPADFCDARRVASMLNIPYYVVDFEETFQREVIQKFVETYQVGLTPNPCIDCNNKVKFRELRERAKTYGCGKVATGHYARITEDEHGFHLLRGLDNDKDQSYFLCQLSQEQLAKALFPIGHLQKSEVREIAKQAGLITAEKKDSQGLCFIGKVRLPDFLQQQLKPKTGKIIQIPKEIPDYQTRLVPSGIIPQDWTQEQLEAVCTPITYASTLGKAIGEHSGAHYFTVGQRKGLQVGGTGKPLFVIATDTKENIIYTGLGEEHPGLNRFGLFVPQAQVHWIREDLKLQAGETAVYSARIRYRQALSKATLIQRENGLYVVFEKAQKGIASGQFVAWYQGEECIGSGTID
jgi:tRNA-specific 2-thiouridylase